MGNKIWNKRKAEPIIRYSFIILLIALLLLLNANAKWFNLFLLSFNKNEIISNQIWSVICKSFIYSIYIFLNFCILYTFTQRFKYSLIMLGLSIFILIVGVSTFILNHYGFNIKPIIIAICVKLNKFSVLLILFIAAHLQALKK